MVVAQKNSILDTAEKWTNEADALKYLRAGLDETSKSYDEIIEKRIQLLRTKWTEQTDENGNRVWTDEEIENTIAGLRKQFSSLDTLGNSAINGINNGLGMTSESAKDTAKNIKDIKKIEFSKAKVFPKTVVFGKTFGNPLFLCFTGIEALFCFPKNAVPKNQISNTLMLQGKRLYSLQGKFFIPVASVIILLYRSNFSLNHTQ